MVRYAKYNYDKKKEIITKDGHTMFKEDIVTDLNRKSYLEGEKVKLKADHEKQIKFINEANCKEFNQLQQELDKFRIMQVTHGLTQKEYEMLKSHEVRG